MWILVKNADKMYQMEFVEIKIGCSREIVFPELSPMALYEIQVLLEYVFSKAYLNLHIRVSFLFLFFFLETGSRL